eukprot:gene29274-36434_t
MERQGVHSEDKKALLERGLLASSSQTPLPAGLQTPDQIQISQSEQFGPLKNESSQFSVTSVKSAPPNVDHETESPSQKQTTNSLHQAAAMGHVLLLTQLVVHQGISLDLKDENGYLPVHLAAREGHLRALLKIIELGGSINSVSSDGCTPLHIAATQSNP